MGEDGKPVWEDLEMRCLVNRLRPKDDGERLVHRNVFMNAVWEVFAEEGLYGRIVRENEVVIGPFLTAAVVPFEGKEISPLDIAVHFGRCGVKVGWADERLTPWSQRNLRREEEVTSRGT